MKNMIKKIFLRFYKVISRLPFVNRFKLRGTKLKNNGKPMWHSKFNCRGTGNVIILHKGGTVRNTTFYISGNNNVIEIGEDSSVIDGEFYIEDDNNKILIGSKTRLCGKIHLACTESTVIEIGNDCLFSSEIVFRTGDSHSLLDMSQNRINPASDIVIGDHVWIGHRVLVNKGVHIASHTTVGTGALVTKSFDEQNIVIAGVPAKVVKTGVDWCSERI